MFELLLLALALAMDAFAVALARGAAGDRHWWRALEIGAAFGAAQGLMPLIGWALGALFLQWIEAVDHWIAFALLSFLGLRMVMEGMSDDAPGEGDEGGPAGRDHYAALFAAAIATSVDAAAAGLTLDLFALPIWQSCLVIGLVTALLCAPAYWFAARAGSRLGKGAEVVGGIVLIGLGTKILAEHTGWL